MMLGTIRKQPADVLDYDIDFSEWLPETDQIQGIDVAITRIDDVDMGVDDLNAKYIINNNPVVKLWLDKGVDGESYKIETTITTKDGRTKQVELRARLRDV